MTDRKDLNRRKILKTLGLTGATSAGVFSERASAQNASGNETVGYGEEVETDSISVLSKTEHVDLTDNPDLGERIWPVNTDASGGVCRPASGGTKPATGPGSAVWFGFGGCGTWKVFEVQPGETYRITSRIDTCFGCVLYDDAYAIQEFVDGSWETQESYPAIKATKTNARVVEYTPDSDRIRVKNINGNRGIGFYLRVYGPSTESSPKRRIAEKFAPTFSFDEDEKFFPTDPTEFEDALYEVSGPLESADSPYQGYKDFPEEYQPEENIESLLEAYPRTELYGPDALAEYANSEKNYTVFYNVIESVGGSEELNVVSYWQYYAFDQYVNIHWHDWEVLHVFFEGDIKKPEETEPVMAVGSAHRNLVPNDEFTGLDRGTIGVLSELGAHANATDVDSPDRTGPDERFKRAELVELTGSGLEFGSPVDVTNTNDAYGLPRDETAIITLPPGSIEPTIIGETVVSASYDIPKIDRTPIYEVTEIQDSLADVSEEDLIENGTNLDRDLGKKLDPDDYDLAPMERVSSSIDEFTGPRLDSNNLSRLDNPPEFVGKAFKTVGEPWKEDNFNNPAKDVDNIEYLESQYDLRMEDKGETIRGNLEDITSGTEGRVPAGKFTVTEGTISDDMIEDIKEDANVSLEPPEEEGTVGVESELRVGPTSNGRVTISDLEEGKHNLYIVTPSGEPYSQKVQIQEGENFMGVNGRVPTVPRDESTKIVGNTKENVSVANLTVSEDYIGKIYDAEPAGEDTLAVYVHSEGEYTIKIADEEGEVGAYRVVPSDEDEINLGTIKTGKLAISQYLVEYLRDSAKESKKVIDGSSGEDNKKGASGKSGNKGIVNSISSKFEGAADAAERAVNAIQGNKKKVEKKSNDHLRTVKNKLRSIENELNAQRSKKITEAEYLIITDRIEQADENTDQAVEADIS